MHQKHFVCTSIKFLSKIRIDAEVRRILMNCKNFHPKGTQNEIWLTWHEAPCKRTQHIWPTTPNIVGVTCCVRFHNLLPVVACCCVLLGVVAQIWKPVKLLRQQLPTFLCSLVAQAGSAIACEQDLLFGQAKRASRERASEGLRRSLARSRETRFTRPNRRACSQASSATMLDSFGNVQLLKHCWDYTWSPKSSDGVYSSHDAL